MTDVETPPVEDEQFPSLSGEDRTEIAKRSADETAEKASRWRKDFVVPAADYNDADDEFHARNEVGVRQFLTQQGLRFPEDGKISHKAKKHPDGVSTIITYRADAIPAAVAETPDIEAHVNPEDQAEAEAKGDEQTPKTGEAPDETGEKLLDPGTPEK